MRRKDREVTDSEKIQKIISDCNCCRVGFNDGGEVYIVPLSFGVCRNNGKYVFYFHSAEEGRKIELIRRSPRVGFEMDANYRLTEDDKACSCTAAFQSVIGSGIVSIVEDAEEKSRGFHALWSAARVVPAGSFPKRKCRQSAFSSWKSASCPAKSTCKLCLCRVTV